MILSLAVLLLAAFPTARAAPEEVDPGRAPESARQWYEDAKFGLFIHWGVYSLLGDGEWVMQNRPLSIAEYEKLPPRFNPTAFDAAEWVGTAKRAGQKYIAITSKHHDGFCMWDSEVSRYDIVDGTPYKKDVLALLADECRKQGIKLFFYHSHLDWHHPDYFPRGKTGKAAGRPEAGDWTRYLDYLNRQIAELCAPRYGAAGFWFDGWWDRPDADWQLARTYSLIHRLRPEALIGNNHHVAPFPGEDFQMFEQDLPGKNTAGFNEASVSAMPLETCRTMNNSWGYNAKDQGYRPLAQQIRYLVEAVGLGANLLLNVGPTPEGKIPPEAVEILLGMGKWLEANGETIYGTRAGPWGPSKLGYAVRKGRRVFFHLLDWPRGGVLELPACEGIEKASVWKGGALTSAVRDGKLIVKLPEEARDPIDTILVLEAGRDLAGVRIPVPPARTRIEGESVVLAAADAEATGKIRLEGEPKNALGHWTDPKDQVTWRIESPAAGPRDVSITYACAAGSGGSEFEVACGESIARGKVHATGDWANFVTVPLGIIAFPAGASEITVRVTSKPDGAAGVMNLRGLTLEAGFVPLFDGKSLAGWVGPGGAQPRGYAAEAGILSCARGAGGNLYTEKQHADFVFRFEFQLDKASNNGLAIRAPWDGDAAYVGMELQILDDPAYEGKIQPWQRHGSIYDVVPAQPGHLRPTGEWNVEEVIARGRKITVRLNGATIVDADLAEVKDPEKLKKHPGLLRPTGHIGFCGHGDRLAFRAIRVKDLGPGKE
jgi:alpha-L-fucosidase